MQFQMANTITVPKASLPDCEVGEELTITGEDGENFILEPQYEEAPAPKPKKKAGKSKGPRAVAKVLEDGY